MAQVRARSLELRQGVLSEAALDDRVTALAAPLANAIVRDYAKWRWGTWSSRTASFGGPTVATWEGQLGALRTFLRARATWMDSELQ
jgi:hypothetical protein